MSVYTSVVLLQIRVSSSPNIHNLPHDRMCLIALWALGKDLPPLVTLLLSSLRFSGSASIRNSSHGKPAKNNRAASKMKVWGRRGSAAGTLQRRKTPSQAAKSSEPPLLPGTYSRLNTQAGGSGYYRRGGWEDPQSTLIIYRRTGRVLYGTHREDILWNKQIRILCTSLCGI